MWIFSLSFIDCFVSQHDIFNQHGSPFAIATHQWQSYCPWWDLWLSGRPKSSDILHQPSSWRRSKSDRFLRSQTTIWWNWEWGRWAPAFVFDRQLQPGWIKAEVKVAKTKHINSNHPCYFKFLLRPRTINDLSHKFRPSAGSWSSNSRRRWRPRSLAGFGSGNPNGQRWTRLLLDHQEDRLVLFIIMQI